MMAAMIMTMMIVEMCLVLVSRDAGESLNMFFRIDFFMSFCSCLEHTELRVYHTKLEITSPRLLHFEFYGLKKVLQDSRSNSIINLR